MVVVLKHDGTVALLREMLKMSVRTSASWSAHPLSTLPGMLNGPAALCWLTLCRIFLTSALVRRSNYLPGGGGVLPRHRIVICFKPGIEHIQRIRQGGITVTGYCCCPVVGDGLMSDLYAWISLPETFNRLSKVGAGLSPVCTVYGGLNKVQHVHPSCCEIHMLMELAQLRDLHGWNPQQQ